MKYAEARENYIATHGQASFADVIIQAFLGYQPPLVWPATTNAQEQLDAALWRPALPRFFNATLSGSHGGNFWSLQSSFSPVRFVSSSPISIRHKQGSAQRNLPPVAAVRASHAAWARDDHLARRARPDHSTGGRRRCYGVDSLRWRAATADHSVQSVDA